MSSSRLRAITTPLRLGARLSPVVVPRPNAEACYTPLLKNRNIRRRRLQFLSPPPVASSSRLSPRNNTNAIRKYEELATTSAEIPQAHVIPSVSTPDREDFFEHCGENLKRWNVLGRGTFGMVIEAKYKDKNVAVKIVLKHRYETSIQTIENEKNVLGLKHPNIINILNVINDDDLVGLIIMEKISGISLQEQLDDDSFQLNTSQRLGYALDISHGIEFCHSQRILHLDIKPYNILVCFVTNTCKLCDFGSSERIARGKIIEANLNTVVYTAPEVLKGQAPTYASDIYSLGVTLWQLQSRKHPYNGLDQGTIIHKVCLSRLRPESSLPTDGYDELYHRCWSQDPIFRPHMKYVIKQLTKLKSSR